MTEAEWLEATDPEVMLPMLLEIEPSERKVRLFCCACCRRIWHLFSDDRCRNAVEIAERFADSLASEDELIQAGDMADEAADEAEDSDLPHFKKLALVGTSNAAAFTVDVNAIFAAEWAVYAVTGSSAVDGRDEEARRLEAFNREVEGHVKLLRDIFGNPLRPVAVERNWLTPNVVSVAQAIYDDHAFDRLPVLADALEEAGCTDASILAHCRQLGPHVRGCWVVDLLLGKEWHHD